MSNVLKFTNSDHFKPFEVVLDDVLRAMGLPEPKRKELAAWGEEAMRAYRIPNIEINISMPEGMTPEQVEHIRLEIFREFARYGWQLRLAKHNWIIHQVKKRLWA